MKTIGLIILFLGAFILLVWALLPRREVKYRTVSPPIPPFAVDVGNPVMAHFSNVVSVVMHTNDCYLITWIGEGKTNEFHAWGVPIQIYFTNY